MEIIGDRCCGQHHKEFLAHRFLYMNSNLINTRNLTISIFAGLTAATAGLWFLHRYEETTRLRSRVESLSLPGSHINPLKSMFGETRQVSSFSPSPKSPETTGTSVYEVIHEGVLLATVTADDEGYILSIARENL